MQPFDEYINEEEKLRTKFINKIKGLSQNVITKAKKLLSGLEFERRETMFMLETFFKKLKDTLSRQQNVTDEDVKRAVKQLGDVGKFSLIAPLFLLPGGGTTTAVLYFTGKKLFNISILPEGLEQVFEIVHDNGGIDNTLKQINEYELNKIDKFTDYLENELNKEEK